MDEPVKILCVDDERNVLRALQRVFFDADYEIMTALSAAEGMQILEAEGQIQLVISDYRMPGTTGVDFLREVCRLYPETIRIVLSGYADTASVVAAINEGQVYRFIPKPWQDDELKTIVEQALETYELRQKNRMLLDQLQQSNEQLRLINENLESLVAERTTELMFQNHALAGTQNIFDALPVAVLGIDENDTIVAANRQAHDLFVSHTPGLLGLSCLDILPEGAKQVLERLEQTVCGVTKINWLGVNYRVRFRRLEGDAQAGILLVLCPEECYV